MDRKARQDRINQIERQCRDIEKKTGKLYGAKWIAVTNHYGALRRELGGLLLQRDREERPKIYGCSGQYGT